MMMLNTEQIIDFTQQSEKVQNLYKFARQIGFYGDFEDYQAENLNWFIQISRLNNLEQINEIIGIHEELLKNYIKEIHENRIYRWRVNPAFICVLCLIAKYNTIYTVENLVEQKWEKDIASIVLNAAANFNKNLAKDSENSDPD